MHIKLFIPESDLPSAIKLLTLRGHVLKVTVEKEGGQRGR